jgi:mannose-1-phosphate guanylyltransferase/mannose-6-phosphate isomerase
MIAVILAGGSGTRLWPLSRKSYPKQFLKFGDSQTLLQKTIKRLLNTKKADHLITITNEEYQFLVKNQVGEIERVLERDIILEPVGKNTAPAIALAVKYIIDKLEDKSNEVIFVSPSDHVISPEEGFGEYLEKAEVLAKAGYIVTFGIQPYKPETGYGYIKRDSETLSYGDRLKAFKVEKFVEKPCLETALEYLQSGKYYWNSGMFAFSIGTILDELAKYAPEIYQNLNGSFENTLGSFGEMPNISIDYAVMEKSEKVTVLPMEIKWSDIGSWDSVYEILAKDENQNVKIGEILDMDTKNSLIIGNKRLISTIGLEDILIAETDDAILITKKGEAQKVKDIVKQLEMNGKKVVDEHVTTHRPWGNYTILEEGPRYKIKRIVVNPGEKLSHQMHHHRSEHWIVVKGTARVTLGEKEEFVHENESTYVPKSTVHRLENPGKVPLELIEVQNGEYVEEDDIIRFDDVYGRVADNR